MSHLNMHHLIQFMEEYFPEGTIKKNSKTDEVVIHLGVFEDGKGSLLPLDMKDGADVIVLKDHPRFILAHMEDEIGEETDGQEEQE